MHSVPILFPKAFGENNNLEQKNMLCFFHKLVRKGVAYMRRLLSDEEQVFSTTLFPEGTNVNSYTSYKDYFLPQLFWPIQAFEALERLCKGTYEDEELKRRLAQTKAMEDFINFHSGGMWLVANEQMINLCWGVHRNGLVMISPASCLRDYAGNRWAGDAW